MSEMDVSDVPVKPEGVSVAPEAVPVVQQTASNAPVEAEVVETPVSAPVPLDDAVRVLLIYVKDGRRAGDGDVDAAIADVEAALSAE